MGPTDPARTARTLRVTAVLTALLGVIMGGSAGLSLGAVRLLERLRAEPGFEAPPMPEGFEFFLSFAERSAPWMVALALVFVVGGLWALLMPRRAPAALARTAELGVAGTIALTVVWVRVADAEGASAAIWASGVISHALQAALIARAWLFLRKPEVRAAAERLSPSDAR